MNQLQTSSTVDQAKNWFAQLGRESELSVAELVSLTGAELQFDTSKHIAYGKSSKHIDWDRFGGIIRSGQVLTPPLANCKALTDLIIANCLQGSGKITLGLTSQPDCLSHYDYLKLLKHIKLKLRQAGRSVRFVAAGEGQGLNAATVINNRLTSRGKEFVIWKVGSNWQVGLTSWVQDINSYSFRDRQRPIRDAAVGMLPPKLAQIMINIANPPAGGQIYDPFCGTGVVLIEASRMQYQVSGSDIEPKMVAASRANMSWYQKYNSQAGSTYSPISQQNAIKLKLPAGQTWIVTEANLGRVDLKWTGQTINKVHAEADSLNQFYSNVLRHWQSINQISEIVLALPFWHIDGQDIRLKLLDDMTSLGYTSQQFVNLDLSSNSITQSQPNWLTYRRQQQIVGRMIVHLTPIRN